MSFISVKNNSNIAPQFYVLDTSFLADIPKRHYWTVEATLALQQPNSAIIVPQGVEREFTKFLTKHDDPETDPKNKILEYFKTSKYISYTDQVRKDLSAKVDAEIEYMGLSHKALSMVDKTILQSAHDLAMQKQRVTIVTCDEAIYAEASNLWKSTYLDVGTLSPWTTPLQQGNTRTLIMQQALDEISHLTHNDYNNPTYLVFAKNMKFGLSTYDIAFGWYVDRISQKTPPRFGDIEYVPMVVEPTRFDSKTERQILRRADRVMKQPKRGSYNINKPLDLTLIHEDKHNPITLAKLLVFHQYIKQVLEKVTVTWAVVNDQEIMRHTPETGIKLHQLRRELKKQK
jgi:hypothetical protein